MSILGHAAAWITAAAAENRKLHPLKAHETLTNIIVGGGVNGATFGIAEKLVQSVVSCTLSDLVVVVQLLTLIDSIVNRTIGRVLGWATIEASGCCSRVLLTVTAIWTKCTIRILISTRCSGKRLQVSDHCSTPVRK
jgi:hypothetical protein